MYKIAEEYSIKRYSAINFFYLRQTLQSQKMIGTFANMFLHSSAIVQTFITRLPDLPGLQKNTLSTIS